MTLREVCSDANVSRRAIQGYEKAGLVSASAKNARGHLLYDESSLERIKKIKFYQQLGFTVKEICEIIEAPNHKLKIILTTRVEYLEVENEIMRQLIQATYELIKEL